MQHIIKILVDNEIDLYIENDKLKAKAKRGALKSELAGLIKANKDGLIDYLKTSSAGDAGPAGQRQAIERRQDPAGTAPTSYAQQRLWFIDKLQAGSPEYNMPVAFNVTGSLSLPVVEQVFSTIIRRHEILRTVYEEHDGETCQRIRNFDDIKFRVTGHDLSSLSAEQRQERTRELIRAAEYEVFDLSRDLMVKASYLHLDRQQGVLLFNMHHIASDGWSIEVLTGEFIRLYQAYVQGEADPLAELPVQYADFAVWQKDYLQGEVLERQLTYWEQQLAGAPAVHGLPLDKTRPSTKQHQGAIVLGSLPPEVGGALKVLAKQHQLTPFMVLQGALSLVLSRHSNSRDIVIGTPVANRMQAELEPMIGFFVNTLVLRTSCRHETLQQYFDHIRDVHRAAQANQDVPFEQLVERLKLPRSASHTPLFQIMLTTDSNFTPGHQPAPAQFDLPEVSLSPVDSGVVQVKFDLEVEINLSEQGGELFWRYDVSLFDDASIRALNTHLCRLLTQIAACRDASRVKLSSLEILSEAERQHLLYELNETEAGYPAHVCIHHLFESQVNENPEHIALSFEGRKLSYRQLNEQANQLAFYLIERHQVTPDSLVGLCAERSIEMVVAILAVLKAGGAYVPLDPGYPKERLAYMLSDSKVSAVLCQSHLSSCLQDYAGDLVMLDDFFSEDGGKNYPKVNPVSASLGLGANHLAYVIYTSGSTGKPKGVMVPHQGLINRIHWMARQYGVSTDDKILQKTPFSFDVSVWEFLLPLAYGAGLVLAKPGGHKELDYLCRLIQTTGVTKLHFVPSMLGSMLEYDGFAACTGIRQVFCSGEALLSNHVTAFKNALPQAELHNLYGPTEAAIDVSYWDCSGDISRGVPIGKPISNTQLLILDPDLNLVPKGAVGELYIGGHGLARGYLNRPGLTSERFIENPYYQIGRSNSSKYLYRTGDLASLRENGDLDYHGRTDHQVKIRGFRIELGEIEHQVSRLPGIDSALVVAREQLGSQQLLAYVKPEAGQEVLSQGQLTALVKPALSGLLPDYMVPGTYMVIDDWPLMPNGKLDRKRLPEPDAAALQQEYVPPVTASEKTLVQVWSRLLDIGAEKLSCSANFFELGGHSLLTVKMQGLLKSHGLEVSVQQIFNAASLKALAADIDTGPEAVRGFVVPENLIPAGAEKIVPAMLNLVELSEAELTGLVQKVAGGAGNIGDIYPLAPLQQGILFNYMLGNEIDPYINAAVLRIRDKSALDVFLAGFEFLIRRHDILRAGFFYEGLPEPVQVIHRKAELAVHHVALTGSDESACLLQLKAAGIARMDIAKAPLIHLTLAQSPFDESYYVLLQNHHLISDHVSLEIISEELFSYAGQEAHLLPASVPFRNLVAHSRYQVQNHHADSFFKKMLGDVTEPTLPFNITDIHRDGSAIEEASAPLPGRLSGDLRRLAKKYRVSLAALFHAAWSLVLRTCSGRADVVFGTIVSGRLQGTEGAERMLGVMINALPFRVRIEGESTASLIRQIHDWLKELVLYEQTPLALARACSAIDSDIPLFNAILNFRHSAPGSRQEGENDQFVMLDTRERTNYPFTMNVDDFGAQGGFRLTAQADQTPGAERILSYMQVALTGLAQALEQGGQNQAGHIRVLPRQEREQQLFDWNQTRTDYDRQACIYQLFEQRAAQAPGDVALVFRDRQLTYGELNRRANRLAHYLTGQYHIRPDALVALCFERSFEMVISILAVMKAGGAYVPVEPGYPRERIRYLLQDAAPELVLTQGHLTGKIAELCPVCLPVDTLWAADGQETQMLARYSAENPDRHKLGLTAANLAYVIYTSGSTGKPKGVMVEHGALFNRIDWMDKTYRATPQDSILQKTPYSFDVSVWEFMWPLSKGAKLVIAEPEGHKDPVYLCRLIREQAVTKMHFVPSMLGMMLEHGELASCDSVRQVFCSGEALQISHVSSFKACLPGSELHNLYGPTEAAIDVSHWDCLQAHKATVPIGYPIQNTQLLILDDQLQLLSAGAVGELHIGGDCLARGYLNRNALTAEKFIANPFYGADGLPTSKRLYKTGDLARLTDKGAIEYVGRIDHQVKIRGFRIELGEIEHQLALCPDVDSALVLADSFGDDNSLLAYVKLAAMAQNGPGVLDGIRQALSASLPEFMVPDRLMVLDEWPLTANGKIDRKALPRAEMPAANPGYVAPANDREKLLAQIWQDLLAITEVGATDSFFRLGGHSLLVIKMLNKLKSHGFTLPLKAIYEAPDLAALAARLTATKAQPGGGFVVPDNLIPENCPHISAEMLTLIDMEQDTLDAIVGQVPGGSRNIQDIYPLSPLQKGILFHHVMDPDNDPYRQYCKMRIAGRQVADELVAGFNFIIRRHDVLRTLICWDLEEPVNIVLRQAGIPVAWHHLEPEQSAVAAMDELARNKRLSLSESPLMALDFFVAASGDEIYALLTFHHLISDNMGMETLLQEIARFRIGQEKTLPEPVQYRQFVAEIIDKTRHLDSQAFFADMLADVAATTAPYGVEKVSGIAQITEKKLILPQDIAGRIRELAKDRNMSPAAFFHMAFAVIVARLSRRKDVVFATVLSGRQDIDEARAASVGMFLNSLPIRVNTGSESLNALLSSVNAGLIALLEHEHYPLSSALAANSLLKGAPLFTSVLNYRRSGSSKALAKDAPEQDVEVFDLEGRTNYPFSLGVTDYGAGFELSLKVEPSIDAEHALETVRQGIVNITRALSATPGASLAELELFAAADEVKAPVLQGGPAPGHNGEERSLQDIFADTVKDKRMATALILGEQALTFDGLDKQSNQLARYLAAQDIRAGDRLGLCLLRSTDMVVAMLASIKLGAVYVPMEPDWPQSRIDFILDDAGVKTVLVHRDISPAFSAKGAVCLDDDRVRRQLAGVDDSRFRADIANGSGLDAYVIYTSGSTGTPKGVLVSQDNVINYSDGFKRQLADLAIMDHEPWLWNASYAFDASVKGLVSLLYGRPLVLCSAEQSRDPGALLDLMAKHRVRVFNSMPAMLEQLMALALERNHKGLNLISSGEDIPERIWQLLLEYTQKTGTKAINAYGPTETTVNVSYGLIKPGMPVNIGRPLPGVRCYVLDEARQAVASGMKGELYVAGACLARGYLNRPELTAAAFGDNPFDGTGGSKIYRTGDWVKLLPGGEICFLGRTDGQVKNRGYRIELGEIEHRLLAITGIRQAVVMLQEMENTSKKLFAYVAAPQDSGLSQESILSQLTACMPAYMLPDKVVVLAEFPTLSSGKVDKSRLLLTGKAEYQAQYQGPKNETEEILCEIWQHVLNLARVSVQDNFFQLGGDSILSMQVVAMAKRKGLQISIRQLFAAKTIAELAKVSRKKRLRKSRVRESKGEQLLLPVQSQWFAELADDGKHFNQSLCVHVPASLTASDVHSLIDELCLRHDAFRLRFTRDEAGSWQAGYLPQETFRQLGIFRHIDLSGQGEDERKRTIKAEGERAQRDFVLEQGGLLRAVYFDFGDQDGRLLLVAHHLVIDGVSWRIIAGDLQLGYQQLTDGKVKLHDKTASYQSWAQFLKHYVSTPAFAEETAYWQHALRQPVSALPGLTALEPVRTPMKSWRQQQIALASQETAFLLSAAGAVYDTEINELLLSALFMALKGCSRASAFRITMEGHGREMLNGSPDVSETVGWFTSKYPVTLAIEAGSLREIILGVKKQYRAVPNKGIGYGMARFMGDAGDELDYHNQLVFNYLGNFDQTREQNGQFMLAREEYGDDIGAGYTPGHSIVLNGMVWNNRLSFTLSYCEQSFDAAVIEQFAAGFQAGLHQVVEHCRQAMNEKALYQKLGHQLDDASLAQIVLPLNKSVTDIHLFCAPPVSGTSIVYQALAKELEGTVNFQGLQLPDLYTDICTTSIEGLAALYCALIKRVQPEGPYHIMGWSSGGTVAYEIAAQLKASGEQIAFLGILDQPYRDLGENAGQHEDNPYLKIEGLYGERLSIDWHSLRSLDSDEAISFIVQQVNEQGLKPDDADDLMLRRHFTALVNFPRVMDKYQPGSAALDIELFKTASGDGGREPDKRLRWGEATSGEIRVTSALGEHINMVYEPFAGDLAEKIKLRLQDK
ncbi:amino acid adenylation domain-containing protein [Thalassomonas viridans]|uniref:Amino acid adenylation domain-containing protein n=1 Tax=Thalassomonas viridans TaxID=137584 RepID=A0AAE9Z9U2_9GAMM|nr:non-ribosomal peptide synthetase [Thalassomonas viridans]WDE09183.1 amino acid adenylation domain-containing protein [Thalassomonas viridans]